MIPRFRNNPAYLHLSQLLIKLHLLMKAGEGESDEAYRVRDEMERHWPGVDDDEAARLRGISADLYSLEADSPIRHHPEPFHYGAIARQLEEARRRGQWANALSLMREFPGEIGVSRASYFRARAYDQLGEPEVARLFYIAAAQFDIVRLGGMVAYRLDQAGFAEDAREIIQQLLEHETELTEDGLLVCGRYLLAHLNGNSDNVTDLFRRVVQRTELKEQNPAYQRLRELAYHGLLACLIHSGHTADAVAIVDKLIEISHEGDYYAIRGLLWRKTNSAQANRDFQAAANRGTNIVWAFFYLAHAAIHDGRHGECIEHCEHALRLSSDERLRAQLFGWMAICFAELDKPERDVKELFEKAIALAPDQLRLQKNQELYLQRLANDSTVAAWNHDWSMDPDNEEITIGSYQQRSLLQLDNMAA